MEISKYAETQHYFLSLLGAVVRGDSVYPEPPDNTDWDEFAALTINSSLIEIIMQALEASEFKNVSPDLKINQKFIELREYLLFCDTQRTYEINLLFDAFERRGIYYLPLKGWVVKDYYPDPLMRTMNDIDILFNLNKNSINEISDAFKECGFRYLKHMSVHSIYIKGILCVEAHEKLLSSWSSYEDYYSDDWGIAKKASGCRYYMTAEDTYIYLLLHFDKHLNRNIFEKRITCVNIRGLLDLYVWRLKNNLDYKYITAELEKIGLVQFENNIRTIEMIWFEGQEASQTAVDICNLLLAESTHHHISRKLLLLNRFKDPVYFKRMLFPNKDDLKTAFPIICSKPKLTPLYRILNFFQILFYRFILIILHPIFYNANNKIDILLNVDISK